MRAFVNADFACYCGGALVSLNPGCSPIELHEYDSFHGEHVAESIRHLGTHGSFVLSWGGIALNDNTQKNLPCKKFVPDIYSSQYKNRGHKKCPRQRKDG
jgi:hypothetical protein